MSQSTSSQQERILGSFASLFSTAFTENGESTEGLTSSASTLPRFISSAIPGNSPCCKIPSLLLKHADSSSITNKSTSLEEAAALNLARPLVLVCGELEAVPSVLLGNVSESFMSLVDSRLRSSLAALLMQSQKLEDSTLTRVLVGLLACSSRPLSPTAVVTSFRVLPVSDRTNNGDYVLPLVMEVVVDLIILGNLVTVTMVGPGTIQGSFRSPTTDCLLANVEIILDTVTFLQCMMKQARYVVRKAIAISSMIASRLLIPSTALDRSESDTSLPVKVMSFSTTSTEQADNALTVMPPPPNRQSQRSLSQLAAHGQEEEHSRNAVWPVTGLSLNETGLNMLMAAAASSDCRSEPPRTYCDSSRETLARFE